MCRRHIILFPSHPNYPNCIITYAAYMAYVSSRCACAVCVKDLLHFQFLVSVMIKGSEIICERTHSGNGKLSNWYIAVHTHHHNSVFTQNSSILVTALLLLLPFTFHPLVPSFCHHAFGVSNRNSCRTLHVSVMYFV